MRLQQQIPNPLSYQNLLYRYISLKTGNVEMEMAENSSNRHIDNIEHEMRKCQHDLLDYNNYVDIIIDSVLLN